MLGLGVFEEKCDHLPNVYFDTSGSERVRERDILEAINLFGSDALYARVEDQIRKIERLNLSDRVKESIFTSNIEHVLSLS